jgi:hypothetical protein
MSLAVMHKTQTGFSLGPALRRHAWPALALAAISACIVVDAALLRIGVDDLDEGYFAEQAARVVGGALPYRDFDSLYTPGLLYLNAMIFSVAGGPTLVGMRLTSLVARALAAVGLYIIGRSVTPSSWGMWPPLLLLVGLDTVPLGWEPHPAWYALLGTLLVTWLVARGPATPAARRWVWMSLAGGAVAFTFLFKQNTGVLVGLAVIAMTVLEGFDLDGGSVTRPLLWLQLAVAAGSTGLVVLVLRSFLDAAVLLLIVSPMVLAVSVPLLGHQIDPAGVGVRKRLAPLIPFAAGGLVLTLPWMLALVVSMEGQLEHLGAFVGAVDQSLLFSPLQLPDPAALVAIALGVLVLAVALARRTWVKLLLTIAIVAASVLAVLWTRAADEPVLASALLTPQRVGYGIVALLPALAAWCGWFLVRRRPRTLPAWRVRWYLTIGSFLLITQYPRMDTLHLAWSAPLLLVVGALVMASAYSWLIRRWNTGPAQRALVAASLVGVLLIAALPGLYDRAGVLYAGNPDTGWPERTGLLRLDRPAAIAGFRTDPAAAYQLRDVLAYLQAETSPREPIFVYPSSPLLYVLADRPNPTRYSHVYPGLSVVEQQALTRTLDSAGVRTVVVSDAWLDFWGSTDKDGVISAYLDNTFQERQRFGVFRVLTRREARRPQRLQAACPNAPP